MDAGCMNREIDARWMDAGWINRCVIDGLMDVWMLVKRMSGWMDSFLHRCWMDGCK